MFKTYNYKIFRYCKTNISEEYLRTANFSTSEICKSPAKATVTLQMIPDIEDKLKAEEMKHRQHPGVRKSPPVSLPKWLDTAVHKVLLRFDQKNLMADVQKLTAYLYNRRLPIEQGEIQYRTLKKLDQMNVRADDVEVNNARVAKCLTIAREKLRSEIHRWKPLDYTERLSVAYLVSRLAPNYACTSHVFSEIQSAIPSFEPKTCFDFGSGVGSATWAAHSFWAKSLEEYFCVDASPEINSLCELLLRGGEHEDEDSQILKNVYFRQFLPASNLVKYDLVVSAFSMMDLPSLTDRLRVIDTLWQKTNDVLVIIENGGRAGFSTVLDARDYILEIENKIKDTSLTGAHIVVPCPHKMACPLVEESKITPCQFSIKYYSPYPKMNAPVLKKDVFTYVVLKRGHKQQDSVQWPRIVKPVVKGSQLIYCRLCCNDGKFQDLIVTKGKHGRHVYRCARQSSRGDLLPVKVVPLNKNEETAEQETNDNKQLEQ